MFTNNSFDLIPDQFISYDDDFIVKQEKLSDPDVALPSYPSESASFYPSFLRNMLEATDLTLRESLVVPDSVNMKRPKPFKIIRPIKAQEDHADSIEVKIEPEKKLMTNTRREYRREVAKKKTLRKMEAKSSPFASKGSLSPDDISHMGLDDKGSKKMLQMIRNRISAQNSRDRRKNYLYTLERSKEILFQENLGLSVEKSRLIEEMERLKESNALLMQERQELVKKQGKTGQSVENGRDKLDIDRYMKDLGILKLDVAGQKQKSKMGMTFSLGLLLSVMMMMQVNEQQNMLTLDGQEQAKTNIKSEDTILLELEKKYMMPLRKCSQSTTISSHGSPLLFAKPMVGTPNEIDMSRTMGSYNDGTDDGWATLDHDISPLGENKEDFSNVYRIQIEPELHAKNFDMGAKDLLVNMQSSLDYLKGLRGHDNQTGKLLDLNLSH